MPKTAVLAWALVAAAAPGLSRASAQTNGVYYLSALESDPEVRTATGSSMRVGRPADITIREVHVYSRNNANTDFDLRLETSEHAVTPKTMAMANPVAFRVGEQWYGYRGGAGKLGGPFSTMCFEIPGQDGAEAAAKWLAAECVLRSPPGYKLYVQFVPAKADYTTNEPVVVTFKLKNLDDRAVIFQRGGQQRGPRDNQYGFRAFWRGVGSKSGGDAVPDVGDATNRGGLCSHVELKPGQEVEYPVDLKKWFAFDKPGRYAIHGFYYLTFYRSAKGPDSSMPWSILWTDYASADFDIEVK